MVPKKLLGNSNGNGAVITPTVIEPKKARMILSAIKESDSSGGEKIVLYAPEGWGKTTWAAHAADPVFLSTEDGLKSVKVKRFPEPEVWQDVFDAIENLRKDDHAYKSLVFDTIDWTEHLCQSYLCRRDSKKSIEDYGFGKGYVLSFEEWKRLLMPLDALRREKGTNIIFLAHCAIRTFNNPSGENYDRYELKTDRRISALIKEWADCVLFGNYDVAVDVKDGRSKGKAYGGDRQIYANHNPAYDAKNRYGILEPITGESAEQLAAGFWQIVEGGK